jgi:hypothetical protein
VTSWCTNAIWLYCGPGTAQVRALNVVSDGGTLAASTVLNDLARFPLITQMIPDQHGHLTIMEMSGVTAATKWVTVTVDQVSAASGAVLHVRYQQRFPAVNAASDHLASDPSGEYLLLWADPGQHGWLDGGVVRPLPVSSVLPWLVW